MPVKFRNIVRDREFKDYDEFYRYVVGELGVAKRHLARLRSGTISPSIGVMHEIQDSIDRCELALSQTIVVEKE